MLSDQELGYREDLRKRELYVKMDGEGNIVRHKGKVSFKLEINTLIHHFKRLEM